MPPREWHLSEALHSFRRLKSILDDLTEEEVLAALKLEHASRRRSTMLRLLAARATAFNNATFIATLRRNNHGT